MKIANSSITMSSTHSLNKAYSKNESLTVWGKSGKISNLVNNAVKDKLQISRNAFNTFKMQQLQLSQTETQKVSQSYLSEKDKQRIRVLEETLSIILGRKVTFIIPRDITINNPNVQIRNPYSLSTSTQASAPQALQGWGINYTSSELYSETETMNFKSSGIINTSDGKQINFNVQLNMARSFSQENNFSFKAGDALVDPLVINYDGKAAELSTTKFEFDIDSDGSKEQISSLLDGSGFLSIDGNENGKIDDGSELFGPKSGNAFTDLGTYDGDKNGWIDENDSVFDKLRIWTKDSQGKDVLFSLGEKGIGAIYLGNINSEFSMKDAANNTLGQAKEAGIFLKENGSVGTMQNIDVVI